MWHCGPVDRCANLCARGKLALPTASRWGPWSSCFRQLGGSRTPALLQQHFFEAAPFGFLQPSMALPDLTGIHGNFRRIAGPPWIPNWHPESVELCEYVWTPWSVFWPVFAVLCGRYPPFLTAKNDPWGPKDIFALAADVRTAHSASCANLRRNLRPQRSTE